MLRKDVSRVSDFASVGTEQRDALVFSFCLLKLRQ